MNTSSNLSAYRDIGRVANAAEPRTSAMTKGTDGNFYLVICAREFVVSTNLHTMETGYYPYPDGYEGWPFGSIGSKNGCVYLCAGAMFLEFDPAKKAYTFHQLIHSDELWVSGWTLTEGNDGVIYFGGNPKTYLTSFNPKTRKITDYGIIEPDQSYVGTLAVDRADWLYCTIATEAMNVIGINTKTGERKYVAQLPGPSRVEVCRATDGEVYCTFNNDGHIGGNEYCSRWTYYRLFNGELLEEKKEPFTNYYTNKVFFVIHCPYEEHPTILEHDLVEHILTYIHPDTGETVTVTLNYETNGAELSPLTEGPDGKIYGTTNHPFQFFTYDSETDNLTNYGLSAFSRWLIGNICAYAVQGDIMGGAAYCGGHIIRIDTKEPLCEGYDINPHLEASFEELKRPRSAVSMPDGKTMVFGGYNDNGVTGTGVIVYDSAARTCKSIPNEKMLRQHSVLSMVPQSETQLLCGSCIEAPCGGHVKETEAKLFLYDLETETVLYSIVPVPGARTIAHMKADKDGIIHGITNNGIHFAYDPVKREVLCTNDLSEYGGPVRDGMKVDTDGTIYGLLNRGIYRIVPCAMDAEIISVPPCEICSGMAVLNGKIYFGANRWHLWSYTIGEP